MRNLLSRSSFIMVLFVATFFQGQATANNVLTIEEQSLMVNPKLNEFVQPFNQRIDTFKQQLTHQVSYTVLTQLVIRHGKGIWQDALTYFQSQQSFDDRILYWTRIAMFSALKKSVSYQALLPMQQEKLLWEFELYSRGNSHVKFNKKANKHILVIATDPFIREQTIDAINTAAISTLALDGMILNLNGQTAELKSIILPVNYAYLDKGLVEEVLNKHIDREKVDLVLVLGQSDDHFKLSKSAMLTLNKNSFDNLGKVRGNNETSNIPLLANKTLHSKQKLANNWKYNSAIKANASYVIAEQSNPSLSLINEIFYRALNVSQNGFTSVDVGQIDMPTFTQHNKSKLNALFNQLSQMLTLTINDD